MKPAVADFGAAGVRVAVDGGRREEVSDAPPGARERVHIPQPTARWGTRLSQRFRHHPRRRYSLLTMPPKAKDPNGPPATEKKEKDTSNDGIDNYELPRALITRIAKSSVRAFADVAVQRSSGTLINAFDC